MSDEPQAARAEDPAAAAPPPAVPSLGPELRRLLWQMAIGVVVLGAGLLALGITFRTQVLALSRALVDATGGWAVALVYFGCDAVFLPLPQEAAVAFALLGGVPLLEVIGWGCLGTLTGGPVGFVAGRWVARQPRLARLLAQRGAKAHAMILRYGPVGLAVGALTPLPYSITCWAAGALEMRWRTFWLVSLLRIPRVAFYAWLVDLGVIAIL